jgi:hypothetical protein
VIEAEFKARVAEPGAVRAGLAAVAGEPERTRSPRDGPGYTRAAVTKATALAVTKSVVAARGRP